MIISAAKVHRHFKYPISLFTPLFSLFAQISWSSHKYTLFLPDMKDNDKIEIDYSYDFQSINASKYEGWCIHLICLEGEGSFVLGEKCFHVSRGDIVVNSRTHLVKNISPSLDMKVEYVAAPNRMLNYMLPANHYGIGGSIALFSNPVMKVSETDARIFLADIRRIRERMDDDGHAFQREVMGSLCLTMIYDLFGFHSKLYAQTVSTDRTSVVIKGFMHLLEGGACRSRRDASFYATKLNVSVKYLENTVRRMTGNSVTSFIDRYTVPMIVAYLKEDRLSFTQIAEKMNFASLSYFSRYVTKHLGMSPKEYRQTYSPIVVK